MRRRPSPVLLASFALALGWTAISAASCATYRQDLERARAHYDKNEFEQALALLRVLEQDVDSLSTAEQAKYAYSRGMTDYRLSGLANPGTSVADPKQSFRSHARHWLAVSAAIEKNTPGSLSSEEKQRLDDAMNDLNRDVYGGADTQVDADGGAPEGGAASAKPEDAPAKK